MFRVPLLIGLRYTGARQQNSFIAFISMVSVLGLILGVSVLVIVVSVMNGFDHELRTRILGVVPHGVISPGSAETVSGWQGKTKIVEAMPDVLGAASFGSARGMLTAGSDVRIVEIYGIVPQQEDQVSSIPQHMQYGNLADLIPGSNTVVLGSALANQLGVYPGQHLTLILPEVSQSGQTVNPRIVQVQLVGTFAMQAELDYKLALMNVTDLARLTGKDNVLPSIRVRFNDLLRAPAKMQEIAGHLEGVSVASWADQYGDLFKAVEMEKSMMFLLLLLVVAIASFNIISGLVMLVNEKKADIAILRTQGITPGAIMTIFMIQGSVLGIVGTIVGLLLGVVLAINITDIVSFFEVLFDQRVLAGTYFDSVPSDLRPGDLLVIGLVSLTINLLSTLYPSWRASLLQPADVLRYE